MNEINRNFALGDGYSEESFMAVFHKQNIWNDDEYFKLENFLYEESAKYSGQPNIPREIFWPVVHIFSYLLSSISCHFDTNDAFEMKNVSQDKLYQRRERLQLVFEGFFKGVMPNREHLGY